MQSIEMCSRDLENVEKNKNRNIKNDGKEKKCQRSGVQSIKVCSSALENVEKIKTERHWMLEKK